MRTEYTKVHTVTNKRRTVPLEERAYVTGRRPGREDLHGQRRTGGFSIQHQPIMPGTYPMISFGRKLRMAPPPYQLAQSFLWARTPVGADAQVALASGRQREDPLAAVAAEDFDVPAAHKPQETHPHGRRRRKPAAKILGQRRTPNFQVEEEAVVSRRQTHGHRFGKGTMKAPTRRRSTRTKQSGGGGAQDAVRRRGHKQGDIADHGHG